MKRSAWEGESEWTRPCSFDGRVGSVDLQCEGAAERRMARNKSASDRMARYRRQSSRCLFTFNHSFIVSMTSRWFIVTVDLDLIALMNRTDRRWSKIIKTCPDWIGGLHCVDTRVRWVSSSVPTRNHPSICWFSEITGVISPYRIFDSIFNKRVSQGSHVLSSCTSFGFHRIRIQTLMSLLDRACTCQPSSSCFLHERCSSWSLFPWLDNEVYQSWLIWSGHECATFD